MLSKRLSSKLFMPLAACPHFIDSETETRDGGASSPGPPTCPLQNPEQHPVLHGSPAPHQAPGRCQPSALLINARRYSLTARARASCAALPKPPVCIAQSARCCRSCFISQQKPCFLASSCILVSDQNRYFKILFTWPFVFAEPWGNYREIGKAHPWRGYPLAHEPGLCLLGAGAHCQEGLAA